MGLLDKFKPRKKDEQEKIIEQIKNKIEKSDLEERKKTEIFGYLDSIFKGIKDISDVKRKLDFPEAEVNSYCIDTLSEVINKIDQCKSNELSDKLFIVEYQMQEQVKIWKRKAETELGQNSFDRNTVNIPSVDANDVLNFMEEVQAGKYDNQMKR